MVLVLISIIFKKAAENNIKCSSFKGQHMRRPVCRDIRYLSRDKYTFKLSNAQCFCCTSKFQKNLVQNQAAQTSQWLTGIQN